MGRARSLYDGIRRIVREQATVRRLLVSDGTSAPSAGSLGGSEATILAISTPHCSRGGGDEKTRPRISGNLRRSGSRWAISGKTNRQSVGNQWAIDGQSTRNQRAIRGQCIGNASAMHRATLGGDNGVVKRELRHGR